MKMKDSQAKKGQGALEYLLLLAGVLLVAAIAIFVAISSTNAANPTELSETVTNDAFCQKFFTQVECESETTITGLVPADTCIWLETQYRCRAQ